MIFDQSSNDVPDRWLAFELSVLRRLKFDSVSIPFGGEPNLGVHLKRWGARVGVSDRRQWAWTKNVARIENNSARLTEDDLEILLRDAYVPGYELRHTILRKWFREIDAWWFDNVRAQAEKLDSAHKRSLALSLLMSVGDYVRSFNEETLSLRQPLSAVFRRLWKMEPPPVNNKHDNTCHAGTARDFLAEARGDLLFLRLPPTQNATARHSRWAWREEYARGADDFWNDFERTGANSLELAAHTKTQHLRSIEDLLETSLHLPRWAICFVESRFTSAEEIVELIRRLRKVDAIYTKDFSELTGARATIITTS
ncbi:MAG: hypothetical protein H0V88_10980 [Pyrinomonadaceae bacterium]|nr:hypothetical protein [Pyrinomonadaceae bacterium]